jgi:hypothetical protein
MLARMAAPFEIPEWLSTGQSRHPRRSTTIASVDGAPAIMQRLQDLNHQTDAFAKDPYAASTALCSDVGPALPEEDTEGRLRQARMIEAMRATTLPSQDRSESNASQHEAKLVPVNLSPTSQTIV